MYKRLADFFFQSDIQLCTLFIKILKTRLFTNTICWKNIYFII